MGPAALLLSSVLFLLPASSVTFLKHSLALSFLPLAILADVSLFLPLPRVGLNLSPAPFCVLMKATCSSSFHTVNLCRGGCLSLKSLQAAFS